MAKLPNEHEREFAYERMARFGPLLPKGCSETLPAFVQRIRGEAGDMNSDVKLDLLLQLPEARIERAFDGSLALNFVPASASPSAAPELERLPPRPPPRLPNTATWWLAEKPGETSMIGSGRMVAALPADTVVHFADRKRVIWSTKAKFTLPKRLLDRWTVRNASPEDLPKPQ